MLSFSSSIKENHASDLNNKSQTRIDLDTHSKGKMSQGATENPVGRLNVMTCCWKNVNDLQNILRFTKRPMPFVYAEKTVSM